MLTGNKGEWSEIYALFKLLGDKQLYAGDAHLARIQDLVFPIVKIIREESAASYEFEIDGDVVLISGGEELLRIPVTRFNTQALNLLEVIKRETGSFPIPEIEEFMTSVNCYSIKAKSTSKTDIRIVIHDRRVNQDAELGFSIKSQLGGDATLLNAGRTTNFVFEIKTFEPTDPQLTSINSIETRSKIKDRILAIKAQGGTLQFQTLEQPMFRNNLVLIDTQLPTIVAFMLETFFTTGYTTVKDLVDELTRINPLDLDVSGEHKYYEYKIKRFLTDIALGMTPSRVWNGRYDATGGYLVVKEDGDVLCYHIYNRNEFEDYLFANTKLETASSTRHDFGMIYRDESKYYFKLNLQIRFK